MKKVLILLMTLAVLLSACQDSVPVNANWIADLHGYYLELDKTELTIDNRGGYTTFNVTSEGTPWVITDVPDWVELSADKGASSTTVTVRVPEYKQAGDRYCLLKFLSDTEKWSYKEYISVTQIGAGPKIELAKRSFVFDGNAHEETVAASSNFKWRIVKDNDWLSVVQGEDEMVVSVMSNDYGQSRKGTAFITEGSVEVAAINVFQEAATATVAQDPLHFDMGGGTCELTVTSEAPWKVGNSSSWWGVNPNHGDPGTTEVTIRVSRNHLVGNRSDKIGFRFAKASTDFATIDISQEGAYLKIADESPLRSLSAMGGETHVTLDTNIPWEITEVPDFLTVSPMSGEGTTELTLTYPSNHSFDEKHGDLFIGWVDHTSSWSYRISQRSRTPSFSGPGVYLASGYLSDKPIAILQCDASAQTCTVKMDIDGPWSIVYERSFFDVTPTSSTGSCTLTFTVEENDTRDPRSDYVNIRPRGVPSYDDSQPSPWYILISQDRKASEE